MSNLLFVLSGRGIFVKHPQPGLADAREQHRFERKMAKNFFKPLKQEHHFADGDRSAILTLTKASVRLGNLTSLHEILEYIINVSHVSVRPDPYPPGPWLTFHQDLLPGHALVHLYAAIYAQYFNIVKSPLPLSATTTGKRARDPVDDSNQAAPSPKRYAGGSDVTKLAQSTHRGTADEFELTQHVICVDDPTAGRRICDGIFGKHTRKSGCRVRTVTTLPLVETSSGCTSPGSMAKSRCALVQPKPADPVGRRRLKIRTARAPVGYGRSGGRGPLASTPPRASQSSTGATVRGLLARAA